MYINWIYVYLLLLDNITYSKTVTYINIYYGELKKNFISKLRINDSLKYSSFISYKDEIYGKSLSTLNINNYEKVFYSLEIIQEKRTPNFST